mgnify:CR=1 FL=1
MLSCFYVTNNVSNFSRSLKTIHELQSFECFEVTALGGGTNLAIRYQHRISTDIDIFFPGIIGKAGYVKIINEVQQHAHFCHLVIF